MGKLATSHIDQLHVDTYPHFVKYMGSKTQLMEFVVNGLNEIYGGGAVVDLFAGSASLAGAIGRQVPVHSNDIQNYSSILSDAYLNAWHAPKIPTAQVLIERAAATVKKNRKSLGLNIDYSQITDIDEFNLAEKRQQILLEREFRREWHLFVKNYSGTWWSAEQCLWIDAFREIAEDYRAEPFYALIISSLMYAMAYTSQGTGHYAQYRDAKTMSSMKDIMTYRKRSVSTYFERKYYAALDYLPINKPKLKHRVTSLDFVKCLSQVNGGTVYADPPYCFVHYSRFYHALETLVLYDYPSLQQKGGRVVKGRYREGRHQSPFCIGTQVPDAFKQLFFGVRKAKANLVLSYSNTGMITLDDIGALAADAFGKAYVIDSVTTDYKHMTLGRQFDRHRQVEECLVLIKRI